MRQDERDAELSQLQADGDLQPRNIDPCTASRNAATGQTTLDNRRLADDRARVAQSDRS